MYNKIVSKALHMLTMMPVLYINYCIKLRSLFHIDKNKSVKQNKILLFHICLFQVKLFNDITEKYNCKLQSIVVN